MARVSSEVQATNGSNGPQSKSTMPIISNQVKEHGAVGGGGRPGRIPKRVLHFSDGVLEEYSDDDEVDLPVKSETQLMPHNLAALPWGPWIWHQTLFVGTKVLEVCDYLGEMFANVFGITSPKYEFEIEHYKRLQAEEEELRKRQDMEMGGWTSKSSTTTMPDSSVFQSEPESLKSSNLRY